VPERARQRIRRPRVEREREILAAARWVFAKRGYALGSVAEIAERVGVVEGTIYTYFESKRELLARVVGDFYENLIREVSAGLHAIHGAENRLRFLIARHLHVYVEDLGLCRLVLSEIRPDPHWYGETVLRQNRRYTALATAVIEEGIRDGELRADLAPAALRDLIYGGIEHALWRFVFSGAKVDVQQLGRQLGDVLILGVVKPDGDRTADRLERALSALERRAEAT
jgi:AcrR family transcriptional regulator